MPFPLKRNKLDSIARFLDEFRVMGTLISMDVMGCQTGIAEQIVRAGGDYLLQVKSNHPTLLQEMQDSFPKIDKGYTRHKE